FPRRRADFHPHSWRLATIQVFENFLYSSEILLINPVHNKPVGCEQYKLSFPLVRLQGSQPGIALLCGKLDPEYLKTLMPHAVLHDRLLAMTHKILEPDAQRLILKDDR